MKSMPDNPEQKILTREEKLAVISDMTANHHVLCPDVFDAAGHLLPAVRAKLLAVKDFVQNSFLDCFPGVRIYDVRLCGSLCSYIYSPRSDLDLFILLDTVLDNQEINNKIFNVIDVYFSGLEVRPRINTHRIDYGVLHKSHKKVRPFNSYSVITDNWLQKPVRRELSFTPQELYRAYAAYSARLHQLAAGLAKTSEGFLTSESQNILTEYLNELELAAYVCKIESPEHEYGLEYNLYRLLKRFGAKRHFYQYINDSYKKGLSKRT